MANILLTSHCNRSCPYCFAQVEMAGAPRGNYISWENLIYIADFLKASGERHISLLGGEPTIHPKCVDFILYLLERDFAVTIFTNGILTTTRLEEFKCHLMNVRQELLHFVCNLNDPVETRTPEQEAKRIHEFLCAMGPWTNPGFNIYRLDFTLDFLFEAINRYGMHRNLRLGLTHPIPGKENGCIRTSDIRRVLQRLYSYKPLFDRFRVRPGLDCGFPICKFSDEELGWLYRLGPSVFGCGPAFDISPDMSVYYCFPLSNYQRKSLFEFDSVAQIDEHFRRLRDAVKSEIAGIYPECDGCRYQEQGVCGGGGICRVLGRFIDEAPVRLPEIENGLSQTSLSK